MTHRVGSCYACSGQGGHVRDRRDCLNRHTMTGCRTLLICEPCIFGTSGGPAALSLRNSGLVRQLLSPLNAECWGARHGPFDRLAREWWTHTAISTARRPDLIPP
eukprot:2505830-Rhodomonas_salina.1